MGREVVLFPDIGEGVVEGEVVTWLKKEGEQVELDEPVVVVMTDKATVELPSPVAGCLVKQHYREGAKAEVDQPLYEIDCVEGDAVAKEIKPKRPRKSKKDLPERVSSPGTEAIPAVRHLAHELGVSLETLQGTGKGGRIEKRDLLPSGASDALVLPDDELLPLVGVARAMAEKMSAAKEVCAFSYFEQVEVTKLVQMRARLKKKGEEEALHVTFMPLFLRALSLTLAEFPLVNSSLDGECIRLHRAHNVGIAMHSERGLIVPVLKRVEALSLPELVRVYEQLIGEARAGKLSSAAMKEATVTISNYGAVSPSGVWATPVLLPPQVAILALSSIQKASVVVNGASVVREVLYLSWTFDHRVIDGELAASFSHTFADYLHNPARLL